MRKKNRYNRIAGVVLCFFAVLGSCTWISRFTRSVLTPNVESQSPISMVLPHTISGNGILTYKKMTPVYIYAGLLVNEVYVTVGQNIQKGDALLKYDLTGVQEARDSKQYEIDELKNARAMTGRKWERERIESQIAQAERSIQQLDDLIGNQGICYADREGIIQEQNQSVGTYSSDTAAFLIGEPGEGYLVSMDIPGEQRAYVEEGDTAVITSEERQDRFVVSSLYYDAGKAAYTIQIDIEGDAYYAGQPVRIGIEHDSQKYDSCLLLKALRSDGNGNSYVLVEREKDTILGTELVAEKVNVKIEDSNMEYAAVMGTALRVEDRVIISTDRDVEAGDVVREKEDQ